MGTHKSNQISRRAMLGYLGATAAMGSGLLAFPSVVTAQGGAKVEKENLKMVLDWAFQGPQAIFTAAQDHGIFKEHGVDVNVDRGNGSTDAVVKVASGAYDVGWAEMSSIVQYNIKNPDNPITAFYVTNENTANSVISTKDKSIAGPKDLVGKKVGSTAGSAARDIFGAFAAANDIDAEKVEMVTVTGALRETMLVNGDVDAILGAITSSVLDIKSLGVPLEDIVIMTYGDFGVPLYGHSLFTTAEFAQKNPGTVAALVRATNAALQSAIRDEQKTVETLKSRDKLVNLDLEKERLGLMLDRLVLTDYVRANGLGSVRPDRVQATIDIISDAYNVTDRPKPELVYSAEFLPASEERAVPK
ncbi:ABC transporter substrate-binding protein [Castellaniella sp.]|uniref:ABC transporter substrate-binding protein n=1 Tax=Castellaniella sp. TaxID=1955812 RepID=UPI00356B0DF0